jgi:hypothetical protein|tara:strand:+ start:273 stop:494 length:222 start_codon:yes stop_codon:yes gene_type:complete
MNIDMQQITHQMRFYISEVKSLQDERQDIKKEFYLLCKSIKDKSVNRDMLIAYANSYIVSQNLNNEEGNGTEQ